VHDAACLQCSAVSSLVLFVHLNYCVIMVWCICGLVGLVHSEAGSHDVRLEEYLNRNLRVSCTTDTSCWAR
jgi:hypothetical protein